MFYLSFLFHMSSFYSFLGCIISPPPAAPTVRPSIPTERTSTKLDACGNGDIHWLQQQNRDAKQQEYNYIDILHSNIPHLPVTYQ
jgi:hypothetical protein